MRSSARRARRSAPTPAPPRRSSGGHTTRCGTWGGVDETKAAIVLQRHFVRRVSAPAVQWPTVGSAALGTGGGLDRRLSSPTRWRGPVSLTYCPECLKKQQRISELEEEVVQLKARLRYQERIAAEGPFGSSTPSSKVPIKPSALPERQARRGGGRPGHAGHGRGVRRRRLSGRRGGRPDCSPCAGAESRRAGIGSGRTTRRARRGVAPLDG